MHDCRRPAVAQVGNLPEATPDAETANTLGDFDRVASMMRQYQFCAGRLVAEKAEDE